MKNLALIGAVLLTLTIFTATKSISISQNASMILILNSDTFYPKGVVIFSGQASPMEKVTIEIQSLNQTVNYRLEAESDSYGAFKAILEHVEPLLPGSYTATATCRGTTIWNEFTVQDESTQLYKDLEQIVKKTRSEATAVYKLINQTSVLATDMKTSIQRGDSYYEEAQTQYNNGNITNALEAYRAALQSYGDALHFNEQLCSYGPPSSDTQLIIELLEKIRRLNDTVTDFNQQPSQSENSLNTVGDLLTQAEKQLSYGDFVELHDTLQELRGAMEKANAETQSISASTTLSRIFTSYQVYYARVEGLENELTIKLSSSQTQFPELFDDVGKIKGLFYLMPWIEAVSSGKPYNSTEPIKQKIDERITALNTSIVEAENKLSRLVELKHNATTLTNIYKAWDLLKDANLSLLSGDVERADELLREATLIMESLR